MVVPGPITSRTPSAPIASCGWRPIWSPPTGCSLLRPTPWRRVGRCCQLGPPRRRPRSARGASHARPGSAGGHRYAGGDAAPVDQGCALALHGWCSRNPALRAPDLPRPAPSYPSVVYVYIHVRFAPAAAATVTAIAHLRVPSAAFADAILREEGAAARIVRETSPTVETVYFGGGTVPLDPHYRHRRRNHLEANPDDARWRAPFGAPGECISPASVLDPRPRMDAPHPHRGAGEPGRGDSANRRVPRSLSRPHLRAAEGARTRLAGRPGRGARPGPGSPLLLRPDPRSPHTARTLAATWGSRHGR
jgi:hypothetical protein